MTLLTILSAYAAPPGEVVDMAPEELELVEVVHPSYRGLKRHLLDGPVHCPLTVLVDESGAVTELLHQSSCPYPFRLPTWRALEQWRFAPPTHDGQPVRARVELTYGYRLGTGWDPFQELVLGYSHLVGDPEDLAWTSNAGTLRLRVGRTLAGPVYTTVDARVSAGNRIALRLQGLVGARVVVTDPIRVALATGVSSEMGGFVYGTQSALQLPVETWIALGSADIRPIVRAQVAWQPLEAPTLSDGFQAADHPLVGEVGIGGFGGIPDEPDVGFQVELVGRAGFEGQTLSLLVGFGGEIP